MDYSAYMFVPLYNRPFSVSSYWILNVNVIELCMHMSSICSCYDPLLTHDACLLSGTTLLLLAYSKHNRMGLLSSQCAIALLMIFFTCCGSTASAARSVGGSQSSLLTRAQAGTPIATGLQDPKVAVNGVIPTGHIMSGQGLWASTPYSYPSQMGGFKASSPGTWGQVCIHHIDLHLYMTLLTFSTKLVNSHVLLLKVLLRCSQRANK